MQNIPLLRALACLSRGEPPQPKTLALLRGLGWVKDGTLTAVGTEALRVGAVEAESESAASLGDANASRESGRTAAAARHLQRAQSYLDLANVLRGEF